MNNPAYFPKLNLFALKTYAGQWARKYPVIQSVSLYRYKPSTLAYTLRGALKVPTRYAVLIQVAENADAQMPQNLANAACCQAPDSNRSPTIHQPALLHGFDDAYNHETPNNFIYQWRFFLVKESEAPPEQLDIASSFWVLFPELKQDRENVQEAPEFVTKEDILTFKKRSDGHWDIGIGDEVRYYDDIRGFHYIHWLLSKPNAEVSCEDLESLFPRGESDKKENGVESFEDDSYHYGESNLPMADLESIAAVKAEVKKLEDESKIAETREKKEEINEKIAQCKKWLGSVTNKDGQTH